MDHAMNHRMEKIILEILLNVIHKADMSDLSDRDLEQLHYDLVSKGYQMRDIRMVLNWLVAQTLDSQRVIASQPKDAEHFRVFNMMEQSFLKPDAQGLLHEISGSGLVNSEEMENIIQQITWFGQGNLDRHDLEELLDVMYSMTDPTFDGTRYLPDNGTVH